MKTEDVIDESNADDPFKNESVLKRFVHIDVIDENKEYTDIKIVAFDLDFREFDDVKTFYLEVQFVNGIIVDARIKEYEENGGYYIFTVDEDDNCYNKLLEGCDYIPFRSVKKDRFGLVRRFEAFLDSILG